MPTRLDFWFDYTCPYAFIASTQVRALAERMKADLVWQPMLLGGVFKANGTPQNLSEVLAPAKLAHNERDFARWAELFGVHLTKPKNHPMRSVEALRATLATGCDPRVIDGFFRAYWTLGRAPSDPSTIRDVVTAAGHSEVAVLEKMATGAIKDDLRARTDRAIALGIFGAPSFVVDEKELFWGQDRMHFVAKTKVDDVLPKIARGTNGVRSLEMYWDFSSPFSYVTSTQAEAVAARAGATLTWNPMLLGGVFRAIGTPMVPRGSFSDAKRAYIDADMRRWMAYYELPFQWPSRFPINTVKAMRCALAIDAPHLSAFRTATYRAAWGEDRDITDDAVLRDLLAGAGADADAVLARTHAPEIKQALIAATQAAVDRGVFGAPTWVVGGEDFFWGQDRIPLVERALVR